MLDNDSYQKSYHSLQKALKSLKNPLHDIPLEKKAEIQGAVIDYYYFQHINCFSLEENEKIFTDKVLIDTPFDLSGLMEWLEACPDEEKRKQLASQVMPFFSKAYGHVFGVDGKINVKNKSFSLEGMFQKTASALVGSFLKEHLHDSKLLSDEEKNEFDNVVTQTSKYFSGTGDSPYQQILDDLVDGKIVSFPSGHDGHSTNITMSKEFLCYTNRGDREDRPAGTLIFKIKDFNNLNPDILEEYFKNDTKNESHFYQNVLGRDIKSDLIELIEHVEFSDQKIGNCSFINNITGIWSAALISTYRKSKNFENSKKIAFELYSELRVHNKTLMLDYWNRLQKIIPDSMKKDHFEIFRKLNQLIFEKYKIKKNKNKEKEGKRVKNYQKMYNHAYEMMSQCSISLKDVLKSCWESSISNLLRNLPHGTFTFIPINENGDISFTHSIAISIKDDPIFNEIEVNLRKENNEYEASIKFYTERRYPEIVKIGNIQTIGELVSKIKQKSEAIGKDKGFNNYEGIKLCWVY